MLLPIAQQPVMELVFFQPRCLVLQMELLNPKGLWVSTSGRLAGLVELRRVLLTLQLEKLEVAVLAVVLHLLTRR
jgi:hypothetical protein